MTVLWHIYEDEGINGADARSNWFATKAEAECHRQEWLNEHREAADEVEFNNEIVGLKKVTVPTARDELARWLWALDVRDC